VPDSPSPQGAARCAAITHHYYVEVTPKQCMDCRWDHDNATTWHAFFLNCQQMELARYKEDGLASVDNNEVGRRLCWGGRILESVMNHILAGDYRACIIIWEPSPPSSHLCFVQPRPEWNVPPE
jgi:hypothetical protein